MADGMLSLSWNNHSTTFSHTLAALRAKERYTDVTLACEGKFYQVHKLVLSTCSEYFENMFDHTPCKHPVIVLSEIHREELEALLSYMYAGYVNVAENSLARLIKVAELLEVKGLAVPDEPPSSGKRASNGHRTNESRVSPLSRNVQSNTSTSDDRNMLGTNSQSPSDDRSSPHPKRQRTRSEVSLLENTHSPKRSSLKEVSRHAEYDHKEEAEPSWDEDDDGGQRIRATEDQVSYQHQESLSDKVQVTLDENLVKEELVEDMRDGHSHSPKYENMADNTSDGGQSNVKLMIPKYEQSSEQEPIVHLGLGQQPPLHEAVIEALAGPSGMQGWAGGGEASRRLEAGSDLSPLPLCQAGTQSIPPLVLMEKSSVTQDSETLIDSGNSIGGSRSFQCNYCPYSTGRKYDLNRHLRTHTGEKPWSCPHCHHQFAQKHNLKNHLRIHKKDYLLYQ
ncbi:protein tramtrack, beta isoform-like isoform X1 [Portunus trituberculatus]|uniref:protein tramtrack, beta isoform-like isoform X1 n=1 Tax=Portunus trituberculatus TaxID=210409 RepID=UPI001E1CE837|nr:protein tramtrack, beta isoform-like isoform X1 [Portunus trituberculatus]XP_045112608.1 protein tramtrack, beta isoform-like isoform X1 [Portunus trituberculatus]XP_045112609.1 protein tramtrack, beta isoform-like isoform X1 [Portunus trituberculatus]XP_045112610.1 protein tramtrack, beta isoform-like isoform X1 [Portunus trituberculatus]